MTTQKIKPQKKIVLASLSPRRKALLNEIKLKFTVHGSTFRERKSHDGARNLAIHNATGKAKNVAKHYKNAIVIGVDTVVAYRDHLIVKPKNASDAKRILRLITGTTHQVISAIHIIDTSSKKTATSVETTAVTMGRMNEKEMDAYIASGEGADKAAGYAIQGVGALYVQKIKGDYFNVVGLPIFLLRKMLRKFSILIP